MHTFSQLYKNKKATINPKNNDDKYFQYDATVALSQEKIWKDYQRISKTKPFINQYENKEMNVSSATRGWEEFERNNPTISFNVLFVENNKEDNIITKL